MRNIFIRRGIKFSSFFSLSFFFHLPCTVASNVLCLTKTFQSKICIFFLSRNTSDIIYRHRSAFLFGQSTSPLVPVFQWVFTNDVVRRYMHVQSHVYRVKSPWVDSLEGRSTSVYGMKNSGVLKGFQRVKGLRKRYPIVHNMLKPNRKQMSLKASSLYTVQSHFCNAVLYTG